MAPQESGGCFAALRYSCKNPSLQSETVHYKRGVSQQFSLPSFKIDFSEWKDDEVTLGNSSGAQTYLQVKHPRTYNVKIKKNKQCPLAPSGGGNVSPSTVTFLGYSEGALQEWGCDGARGGQDHSHWFCLVLRGVHPAQLPPSRMRSVAEKRMNAWRPLGAQESPVHPGLLLVCFQPCMGVGGALLL